MWFSLIGLGVTLVLNAILVPRIGYMGCAWAALACYGVMMLASYFVGRGKYPIDYDVPRLLFYFVIAGVLYAVSLIVELPSEWSTLLFRTLLLCIYVFIVCRHEKISLKDIIKRKI